MVNSKHAFWLALVFTIIVFIIGIALGFFLEQGRSSQLSSDVMKSEISLLDEQLRNKEVTMGSISCSVAVNDTFNFADRIYAEASALEQYDSASKFTSDLKEVHKRYDLLRLMLWDEAVQIRQNCNQSFHIVTYFFNYDSTDTNIKAEQYTLSNLLLDTKGKNPGKILLIPIAANLGLESVNLTLDRYNVTSEPAIVIDESKIIYGVPTSNELQNSIFNSNKE